MPIFRKKQQGAVAIMVGLTLVILIGMLAVVIDLGHLYLARTELQNGADAAALSGAKRLDGTAAGVDSAVAWATSTAGENTFLGNGGQEPVTLSNIQFSDTPDLGGTWVDASAARAEPTDKFFIRVDTVSGNLNTWFAVIWDVLYTNTFGMAVAGGFPPGALSPMFVPEIRRNSDQADRGNGSYPNCKGYIYDNKTFDKTCPDAPAQSDPTDYREVDFSGNWGFLRANQCKQFTASSTTNITCTSTLPPGAEKGSYYVITPKPGSDLDFWAVSASAPWRGNIGFMLRSPGDKTQKSLWDALCRGGGVTAYGVPGCGEVHTGVLSNNTADNLNTRFDMQTRQTALPHELCPSDTNIYGDTFTAADWPSSGGGIYAGYVAGTLQKSPTAYPPGKANRRIIRVFVIDNAWLQGFNIAGSSADDSCLNSLRGGNRDAHLIGCADFFMWKPADNDGKLYAEYVGAVPVDQCNNTAGTFSEIRLYH